MIAITNVPDEIYLVFEYAEEGDDFADFSNVSWCCDRMSDSDVKFVRADRIATQTAEIQRLRALLVQQHDNSAAHICDLAARLNKYEPKTGMYLAAQPKGAS